MGYKPTHLCSPDELKRRREANRRRNEKYLANGGDDLRRRRNEACVRYEKRLRDIPELAEKKAARAEDARERAAAWYSDNTDRAKATAKRNRIRWEKENPHLSVAKVQRRNAAKIKATPAWADNERINRIYFVAHRVSEVTGVPHHVDHVVPLRGKNVSGLHVPENLRIVAGDFNVAKSNRFEV